jgi:hypothetical protein
MKYSFIFLSLTFALSSFAQTFKIQSSTNRANYDICQENHNIILNKFKNQADSQIARLLNGIFQEDIQGVPDFKIEAYKEILNDTIVKRIFLVELKKQLNSKQFSVPGNPEAYSAIKFLKPESIKVNLDSEYEKTLNEIANYKNLKVGKDFLKNLRNSILKETAKKLISAQFRKVAAGLFARMVLGETGRIATGEIIKTATLHFGSEIFVSVGTGLLLNLVTFPLHAYRLPPETEWTELLDEHPELIIVPEWMNKAGIRDHAWMAHCNAIQRRTKHMEKALNEALFQDEAQFTGAVREIFELSNHPEEDNYYVDPRFNAAPADNTRVVRPVVYEKNPGPIWLSKGQ